MGMKYICAKCYGKVEVSPDGYVGNCPTCSRDDRQRAEVERGLLVAQILWMKDHCEKLKMLDNYAKLQEAR